MINVITTIAFDADDTLWVNEPYFQEVEKEFCSLLEDYLPRHSVSQEYRLVIATKGDLLDQERKLKNSGLQDYFHHIEIMSDKKNSDYLKLLKHLNCKPSNFFMLGNSIKSDILPVLEIGGFAAHIPYHMTWAHEQLK